MEFGEFQSPQPSPLVMLSFPPSCKNNFAPLTLPVHPLGREGSPAPQPHSHPHLQLPLPAEILLSWHTSETQISPSTTPPGEPGATVSWIILKASEDVRTWQHPCPCLSPPPLALTVASFIKPGSPITPTCPSLPLSAPGSMEW